MTHKIFIFIICSFISTQINGQIGINTEYPQQLLHIDSKSDNGTSSAPTNTTDDVVITSAGNVGIGTIQPQAKLDVRGKLKITDGTQKQGYILKSDANGLASWSSPNIPFRVDMDNLGAGVNILMNAANQSKTRPTGGYITISPGKSLIRASLYNTFSAIIPAGEWGVQIRYEWSLSASVLVAPQYLNPIGYGLVTITGSYPMASGMSTGFWLINNPNATNLRLYLFVQVKASNNILANGGYSALRLGDKSWHENVLIINEIND